MRQQTIRLNKTPSTEVQAGVVQSGVTQTPTMGFVQQQKTKGQRLAETVGMVVDNGSKLAAKGVELYQGQKDEEAVNQFAEDKFRFLEELNAQASPADKQLLMQNKMQELSQPGVNEKYRNAFVNSFSDTYNKILGQVKEQGYLAQENLMFKEMTVGIEEGMSYEQMTAKYNGVLPKDRWHKVYASAILSNAQFDANPDNIQTPEDLEAFKTKYKTVIANYNANPYAGGSKSVTAADIKSKLLGGIDKLTSEYDKQFKGQFKGRVTSLMLNPSISEEAFKREMDIGLKNDWTTETEYITNIDKYSKARDTFVKVEELNNRDFINDPMIANHYLQMGTEEKDVVKEGFYKNWDYYLDASSGFTPLYNQAAETFSTAPESLVKEYLGTLFDSDQDAKSLLGKLPTYQGLRKTAQGRNALAKLDAKDRAIFEILNYKPNANVEDIQTAFNSKEINNFSFEKSQSAFKKWNKIMNSLPDEDKDTATNLRNYFYFKNKDVNDAIKKVEEFAESRSTEINGAKFIGFDDDDKAKYTADALKNVVGDNISFDNVIKTKNGYLLQDSEDPLVASTITEKQLFDDYTEYLMNKEDPYTIDDFRKDVKTFGGHVNRVVEGTLKDFFSIKTAEEAAMVIPIAVTTKLGVEGFRLAKWMRDTGAVGEFVMNLSSKVVSRGNLQFGKDLLQKAGYNVKFANNNTKMIVTKGKQLPSKGKKNVQIPGTVNKGFVGLGVAGGAVGMALKEEANANVIEQLGNTTVKDVVDSIENMTEDEALIALRNLSNFGEENEYGEAGVIDPEDFKKWQENKPMEAMLDVNDAENIKQNRVNTLADALNDIQSPDLTIDEINNYINNQGYNIDYDFIAEKEGKLLTTGYIPKDDKGNVLGKSGVTVSTGVDLGQFSEAEFKSMGLSTNTLTKIKPYLGLKKQAAVTKLASSPLKLTDKEAKELYKVVKEASTKNVEALFNKFAAKNSYGKKFKQLTRGQQTVVASVFYQYGTGALTKDIKDLPGYPKNFLNQVTSGKWKQALANLKNFGDKYPTRRKSEADYLENN